jgi:hypothetical protein
MLLLERINISGCQRPPLRILSPAAYTKYWGMCFPSHREFKKIPKQFPAATAGKRASRNGVLHWFLFDPRLGPLAGPLQ